MKHLLLILSCLVTTGLYAQDDTTGVYKHETPCEECNYPGGMKECLKFVNTNLRYPDLEMEGKVYVSFYVDTLGVISDVTVKRSLRKDFDEEAVRVIKLMPNWIPANCDGRLIKSRMTLPVVFKRK